MKNNDFSLLCSLNISGVASSSTESGKNYDIFSRTSPTELVAHKYLQAALVADENVEARHGNETAHFLLVLANIVSVAQPLHQATKPFFDMKYHAFFY